MAATVVERQFLSLTPTNIRDVVLAVFLQGRMGELDLRYLTRICNTITTAGVAKVMH
jgi:hypothetical protein